MKVLVTGTLPASALAQLGSADVHVVNGTKDRQAFLDAVGGAHALMTFVIDKVDDAVLEAAGPQLKVVANVAVGYDNIDVPAVKARGILVTNTPDVLNGAVAELTWGMILAITRRLGESERLVRAGGWHGWAFDFMTGMELAGKTLGIIGKGRIGRDVARRASAFDMRVVFGGREAGGDVDGFPVMTIDDVLGAADVVSLHVPMRPDTRHLIDARAIGLMKPSAYLINTARGPVVDEAALAEALAARRIAGAALDVFEREPVVHPGLLGLDNVVLLPHIGSATVETRTAMAELAAKNVAAVLAGRAPITPV
ncbi:MAG: D-glycerate dehydrogenase [Acidobacteria bacterium]|nr:D-glycerate dehydrogenase [Acidobacteriota bacterium]